MRGNFARLGTIREKSGTLGMTATARSTHLYVCGSSGSGKGKFLEHLVRQDIKAWKDSHCGLLLLDPH